MTAVDATAARTRPPSPQERATWRAVAVPAEHGGWGLTAEPVLLGLLVAPSIPGLCLGVAAMVAFLAHTPLRIVLVDRYRARSLDRTLVARQVLGVEVLVIGALVLAAALTASASFWWPALAAAPLVGVSLWFDTRSRSRRLVPELAGTVGITSAAAMIVLAGGGTQAEAIAAWLILAGRAITAIPHVRAQIAKLHGRAIAPATLVAADGAALLAAGLAVAATTAAALGAISVVVVVAVQRLTATQGVPAKVVGLRQMALGLAVVAATAAGLHLT